jgi:hypothetical protein
MTPEERKLVADLFDRLATLEDAPRDPEAERAIREGLSQAPNAIYPLVQTALLQDEALRRATARIQELESGAAAGEPRRGGFLENMRDSIFGSRESQRGSVPTVKPGDAPMGAPAGYGSGAPMPSKWGSQPMGAPPADPYGRPGYGGGYPPPQEPPRSGGSFLGTAAAAAAGMIGGSLLLDSLRSMGGGGHRGHGFSDSAAAAEGKPWGGGGEPDDLARRAGVDDIGRSSGSGQSRDSQQGLFDSDSDNADFANEDPDAGGGFDVGGFDGGGDGGGGD